MTRQELIIHVLQQAREHGFELRKWMRTEAARPWTTADDALQWISQGTRMHQLLFSHSFARAFFHGGERVRYILPASTFQRRMRDGSMREIKRRAYLKESPSADVWRYHLQQMVLADEPLRYVRRFLLLEETLAEMSKPAPAPEPVRAPVVVDYDDELLVRADEADPAAST